MPVEIPDDWDDAGSDADTTEVDFAADPVVIHAEFEDESGEGDDGPSEGPDPDLDNLVVEFVDLFNARDMDSLAELLAADAESSFLHESSGSGVIEGLEDLIFRRPDVVTTRGDLGTDPVAAVWFLDADTDHYRLCGFFTFDLADGETPLIGRIELIEELPDEDLVVETPDDSERPEWEDWTAQDET
jgi:hypothetical protein